MGLLFYIEITALLFSFFSLHPKNPPLLKLVLVICIVTIIAESAGAYMMRYLHQSNHNIYNISVPTVICILFVIFGQLLTNQKHRYIVKIMLATYLVLVFLNFLFVQGFSRFATYNYILGGTFLFFLVCLYFLRLIKMPEKVNLFAQPFFWLAVGVILMYIPKTVLYSIFEYFSYTNNVRIAFSQTFVMLNTILSSIFYASICIACTCRLLFHN